MLFSINGRVTMVTVNDGHILSVYGLFLECDGGEDTVRRRELGGEAQRLDGAIGTRAMTRVRRAVFQERISQLLRD